MKNYIIASNRNYHPDWFEIKNPDVLENYLKSYKPDRVYFPFWSWKIPKEILDNYKCFGFHTGVLPGHAGGSPIQNLIRSGITDTTVTLFRLNEDIDGGEVLLHRPISLYGSLEEILMRISEEIMEMIDVQENIGQSNTTKH